MKTIIGLLLSAAVLHAQGTYPALVSGQSNACGLSPFIPAGMAITVCQGGMPIAAWDPGQPLGMQFRQAADANRTDVLVWWQGEQDAALGTDQLTYANKLYDLMVYANRPVLIPQIGTVPGDTGQITAVHQYFARTDPRTAPYVAWIPTWDLEHDGSHFTPAGYQAAVDRLVACYASHCWQTQ